MRLSYVREVNYLSPSSFMQLESDPIDFYTRRLGPKELRPPREKQGFAAGCGSALDDLVKSHWRNEVPLYGSVECDNRLEAIRLANDIGAVYFSSGAWDMVQSEGEIVECEDEIDGVLPGGSVPLRGKLDINWENARFLDFKVTGAGRIFTGSKPPSPNAGYRREFRKGGQTIKVHKRCDEPLEQLHEKWAIQGAFYHWLLNGEICECPAAIDQLVPQPNGDVRICQFRTVITKDFQERLRDRVAAAWERIQTRSVIDERIPLEMQLLKRDMTPWYRR